MEDDDPDFVFRFPVSPTTHHDVVQTTSSVSLATDNKVTVFGSSSSSSIRFTKPHQQNVLNPRKKRSKLIRIDEPGSSRTITNTGIRKTSNTTTKYGRKKFDLGVIPKCTECHKKFSTWKALFGHMRCHPERPWRGIKPPVSLRQPIWSLRPLSVVEAVTSEDDLEIAASLLMLANGPGPMEAHNEIGGCHFECSSCKKVFGSHQALGGHRASHKNVKGCFAIMSSDGPDGESEEHYSNEIGDNVEDNNRMLMVLDINGGHKCSICSRVFSSGQALGGHKRCHWEKGDEPISLLTTNTNSTNTATTTQAQNVFGTSKKCCDIGGGGFGLDLNLPAPIEDDASSVSYSSSGLVALDLRLGL